MSNLHRVVESMLYNHPKIKAQIKNLELDIESKKIDVTGVAGVSYSNFSAPTNKISSLVENEVINRDTDISKLNNLKRMKEIESERINNALDVLYDREREIIEMSYFRKIRNTSIAVKLDLSEEHICKVKRKAMNKLIETIFG